MAKPPDTDGMLQDDIEKFQRYRRQDHEFTPPSIIEAVFLGLATLVAVAWLGAMFLVPDVIDGVTWMSLGALGMLLFGTPGVAVYWLRRGGAEQIQRTIRFYLR